MIKYASGGKESFKGKRVAVSGSGNVAQYAALKAIELGATVISLSDSKGAIIATGDKGISPELIDEIAALKVKRKQLSALDSKDVKYIDGQRPWTNVDKVDIALPSATQNEVSGEEAEALIKAGCKFVAEGSNMGCTQDAIDVFEKHRKSNKGAAGCLYGAGKAANAGGVGTSHTDPRTVQRCFTNVFGQPCRGWRWRRTASASPGRARRSTRSSRTL